MITFDKPYIFEINIKLCVCVEPFSESKQARATKKYPEKDIKVSLRNTLGIKKI